MVEIGESTDDYLSRANTCLLDNLRVLFSVLPGT